MKSKQEVIQEAWGENWDLLFDSEREHALQNNGWIPNTGLKLLNKITFDFKEMHMIFGSPEQWLRPKALDGIENNRGWTRIESEEDLPKEEQVYLFNESTHDMWIGFLYNPYGYFAQKSATHYQPIIKPESPIY